MYTPPIKGKYLKKPIKPPVSGDDLVKSISSVSEAVNDILQTKNEVIDTVNSKLEEVDSKVKDHIESFTEAAKVLEDTKTEAIEAIKEIKMGPPGRDADESKITAYLESKIPPAVDTEELTEDILSKVPKLDLKALTKSVLKAIPESKTSLKIIRESFETDPMSVIEKIMALPENKFKLKSSQIDGLEQTLTAFRSQLGRRYLHGGGDTVAAGENITITTNSQGQKVISSSGGGGTPASPDTSVQFNDNGAFGGSRFLYSTDGGETTLAMPNVADTNGYIVRLKASDVQSGIGDGGSYSISGGFGGPDSGAGGGITFTGGSAQGTDSDGGNLNLNGGSATGNGNAGRINLTGGSGGPGTASGGGLVLQGGIGAETSGSGGFISLSGGAAQTVGFGGDIQLNAGLGGATSGGGGSISLTAGSAQGGDSDGGSSIITAGAGSGTGVDGSASLNDAGGDNAVSVGGQFAGISLFGLDGIRLTTDSPGIYAKFDTSLLADSDKTFSFPNDSGTFLIENASGQTLLDATDFLMFMPTVSGDGKSITIQAGQSNGGGIGGGIIFQPGYDQTMVGTPGKVGISDGVTFTIARFDTSILSDNRLFTFPDTSGTFALTSDLPNKTATVSLTAQTADIGSTNLTTTGAGLYRLSYYLLDSAADLTAGAVRLNLAYTDNGAAQTQQSATVALTILGTFTQGSFVIQLASGNIAYSTTHTGIFGTGAYDLFITLERLN